MMVRGHLLKLHRLESGFTFVELLIATSVFAIALLTITLGVTTFSKNYSNAVVNSSTQNTVQNVTNSVEKVFRLSSLSGPIVPIAQNLASIPATPAALCIGNTEYNYWLGYEQPTQISAISNSNALYPFALYEEPLPAGGCNASYTAGGQSLLSDNERLLAFSIQQINGSATNQTDLYSINVIVAYTAGGTNNNGNNLLCSTSTSSGGSGGCGSAAQPMTIPLLLAANPSSIMCKSGQEKQFCDVSGLQTNVENEL